MEITITDALGKVIYGPVSYTNDTTIGCLSSCATCVYNVTIFGINAFGDDIIKVISVSLNRNWY